MEVDLGKPSLARDTTRRDGPIVEKRKSRDDDEGTDCVVVVSRPVDRDNRMDLG